MSLPHFKMQQPAGVSSLLKKELDPDFSRGVGTLLAGNGGPRELKLGQPVGKLDDTDSADDGKLVAWDPAAMDGSQIIQGICLKDCIAAEDEDLPGGVLYARRLSILYAPAIVWPDGTSDAVRAAALADIEDRLGLIARI